ncbi:hypothetical protein K0M31_013925 [Melipona bicolor]|uniref:Uncharacterized protein n=1 Tax=Melipona bicolor TaxID=60889 RepID=A0AA40KTT4_9HYME|nr:hypothetical protein K0M31_013925 [Melipona bicolor]
MQFFLLLAPLSSTAPPTPRLRRSPFATPGFSLLFLFFSFDDHDHQAKVVDDDVHDYDDDYDYDDDDGGDDDDDNDDDDDDKYEEQEDDDVNGRGDGRVGGKGVAERRDGEKGAAAAAALVGGGCKILQPRGTHRDVISTTEPETYYNPAVLQLPSHSVSRA